MTPESSNKFYRSVIRIQNLVILVMMGLIFLATGWHMSRMDVVPGDILQEVKIQGEMSSKRYSDMQSSMSTLESKVEERAALIEDASAALTSIQGKLEDHDSRLERIENVLTDEFDNPSVVPLNTQPPKEN